MSNCPSCKESILSQTPSLIGNTLCNPDCPQDITCEDIIPSNCVFYSGATLSCPSGNTSVDYGVTVTVALNKMYQLICQNSTSNTVQVTANDTCYGYLASKITSSSLDITVSNPGGCEKLNIEESCIKWMSIGPNSISGTNTFRNKWQNYSVVVATSQNAEFSTNKPCIVKLRGTVVGNYGTTDKCGGYTIMNLATHPQKDRTFSVNGSVLSIAPGSINCSIVPLILIILQNGDVKIIGGTYNTTYIISLEGIQFEIN
jgi:hypothetical protein